MTYLTKHKGDLGLIYLWNQLTLKDGDITETLEAIHGRFISYYEAEWFDRYKS